MFETFYFIGLVVTYYLTAPLKRKMRQQVLLERHHD